MLLQCWQKRALHNQMLPSARSKVSLQTVQFGLHKDFVLIFCKYIVLGPVIWICPTPANSITCVILVCFAFIMLAAQVAYGDVCGCSQLRVTGFDWRVAWNSKLIIAFLGGAFTKLRRATITFVMSVHLPIRPSVRMERLDSHWTDLHNILYLSIFRISVEKIQVSLKTDKNNGHITWRPVYIYYNIISLTSS